MEEGRNRSSAGGLLQAAQLWKMRVDLGRRLVLPQFVQTSLRPDLVLWSEESKKIILIELMVPWEDGCREAYERKASKYQDLQCRDKEWQAWLFSQLHSQLWEWQEGRGRQLSAGWGRQRKEHLVDSGIGRRS